MGSYLKQGDQIHPIPVIFNTDPNVKEALRTPLTPINISIQPDTVAKYCIYPINPKLCSFMGATLAHSFHSARLVEDKNDKVYYCLDRSAGLGYIKDGLVRVFQEQFPSTNFCFIENDLYFGLGDSASVPFGIDITKKDSYEQLFRGETYNKHGLHGNDAIYEDFRKHVETIGCSTICTQPLPVGGTPPFFLCVNNYPFLSVSKWPLPVYIYAIMKDLHYCSHAAYYLPITTMELTENRFGFWSFLNELSAEASLERYVKIELFPGTRNHPAFVGNETGPGMRANMVLYLFGKTSECFITEAVAELDSYKLMRDNMGKCDSCEGAWSANEREGSEDFDVETKTDDMQGDQPNMTVTSFLAPIVLSDVDVITYDEAQVSTNGDEYRRMSLDSVEYEKLDDIVVLEEDSQLVGRGANLDCIRKLEETYNNSQNGETLDGVVYCEDIMAMHDGQDHPAICWLRCQCFDNIGRLHCEDCCNALEKNFCRNDSDGGRDRNCNPCQRGQRKCPVCRHHVTEIGKFAEQQWSFISTPWNQYRSSQQTQARALAGENIEFARVLYSQSVGSEVRYLVEFVCSEQRHNFRSYHTEQDLKVLDDTSLRIEFPAQLIDLSEEQGHQRNQRAIQREAVRAKEHKEALILSWLNQTPCDISNLGHNYTKPIVNAGAKLDANSFEQFEASMRNLEAIANRLSTLSLHCRLLARSGRAIQYLYAIVATVPEGKTQDEWTALWDNYTLGTSDKIPAGTVKLVFGRLQSLGLSIKSERTFRSYLSWARLVLRFPNVLALPWVDGITTTLVVDKLGLVYSTISGNVEYTNRLDGSISDYINIDK